MTELAVQALTAPLTRLRQDMTAYYASLRRDRLEANTAYGARLRTIWDEMDTFAAAHPDCPACLLKARLLEAIAAHCDPVLFPNSPFFFEMGVRPAESWGTPQNGAVASWLFFRRHAVADQHPLQPSINFFRPQNQASPVKQWYIWDIFDFDHHCPGYTEFLRTGVNGILARVSNRRRAGGTPEQMTFLEAVERSARALLRVAARFAERADDMLRTETDPDARRCLEQVRTAARHVPAEPPRTFYEGLAALWFLREALASLEGIGISVVGHLDRQLIDLYRADLQAGRLTEDEARDLLARWMLPTDLKFHVTDNPWPETSTCMELGGCDAAGNTVFNELTRLILEVHRDQHRLNPKPNCRFSASSPQAYLELIAANVLAGHNNFALLNDDILIPACVRAGKSEAEARLYVNGGCQETIVEGVEHSAGAYYYFNLARTLDLCLQPLVFEPQHERRPDLEALLPTAIADAADFDAFYARFMGDLRRILGLGAGWLRELGHLTPEVQPCPLFSATLAGCVEQARDYTAGGARYNSSGLALVGFSTVVDSLAAVQRAVFVEKWLTFAGLQAALAANWQGHEALRARLIALPKFGHGDAGVDAIATRFSRDIAEFAAGLENERGGCFQPSFFVYYMFQGMAGDVRATPDGRRAGDLLSQGVAPGRVRPATSMTTVFRDLAAIDFRGFPANSVLDVQLPLGRLTPPALAGAMRSFAQLGGPTLQFNCVSPEQLRDAQVHPDRHQDLLVRISGLSAHFVALPRTIQDEIIGRTLMEL